MELLKLPCLATRPPDVPDEEYKEGEGKGDGGIEPPTGRNGEAELRGRRLEENHAE